MKQYEVKEAVALTVQPGSVVILADAQAAAAYRYITEVKKAPAKESKEKSTKKE